MATLFEEEQRTRKNWVWLLCLLAPALMLILLIYQLVTGKMVGDKPVSNLALTILSILYLVPAIWVLSVVKFRTLIDEEKISYGWNIPTNELNEIRLSDIKEWHVIRYRFVGYGYRLSRLYGTVYNVSGDNGLQVTKNNGEKILIGTVRPEELKIAIGKIRLPAAVQ
jgi:hypothetical protein